METTTTTTYETATARIEEIIRRLDSGEAGLRETLDLCREGRELVEFCAAELDRAATRIAEIRARALRAQRVTLDAHDPQRTLERGYALVTARDGDPLATAGALREASEFEVRMADGAVAAIVDDRERRPDGHD